MNSSGSELGSSGRSSDEHDEDPVRNGKPLNHIQNYRSNDTDERCIKIFNQKLMFGHKREALGTS